MGENYMEISTIISKLKHFFLQRKVKLIFIILAGISLMFIPDNILNFLKRPIIPFKPAYYSLLYDISFWIIDLAGIILGGFFLGIAALQMSQTFKFILLGYKLFFTVITGIFFMVIPEYILNRLNLQFISNSLLYNILLWIFGFISIFSGGFIVGSMSASQVSTKNKFIKLLFITPGFYIMCDMLFDPRKKQSDADFLSDSDLMMGT